MAWKSMVYEREKLYAEVWLEPMIILAGRYGISDVGLRKICKRLAVPMPPAGHWAKKRAGKTVRTIPLPKWSGETTYTSTRWVDKDAAKQGVTADEPEEVVQQRAIEALPENTISFNDDLEQYHRYAKATGKRMEKPYPVIKGLISELASHYRDSAGWVDWARSHLLEGDDSPDLAAAYAHLRRVVRMRHEGFDRKFAASLIQDETDGRQLIEIEFALDQCVAKVIEQGRGLLVVLDGMSMAVFLELAESLRARSWLDCYLADVRWPSLLAMLPSTTEASRTSLLSGTARRGDASTEKTAFSQRPSLVQYSVSGKPPILFHKADLLDSSGISLSDPLLHALRDSRQRLVVRSNNNITI